jgi:hypothetical protein
MEGLLRLRPPESSADFNAQSTKFAQLQRSPSHSRGNGTTGSSVPRDIWDDTGDSIVEHVMDDFEVAEATYRAAVARWPAARITLRQGIRVVHDTGNAPTLLPSRSADGGDGRAA